MEKTWMEIADSGRHDRGSEARPSIVGKHVGTKHPPPKDGELADAKNREAFRQRHWRAGLLESVRMEQASLRSLWKRMRAGIEPDEIIRREALLSAGTVWVKTTECADDEILLGFLDGSLGKQGRTALEAHLSVPCRHCLRSLVEMNRARMAATRSHLPGSVD